MQRIMNQKECPDYKRDNTIARENAVCVKHNDSEIELEYRIRQNKLFGRTFGNQMLENVRPQSKELSQETAMCDTAGAYQFKHYRCLYKIKD